MVRRTAMMLITTSSSISVKPRLGALPVMVGHPVEPLAQCQGVDIEDVVARLRVRGWTGVAAQAPGLGRRRRSVGIERIARNPAQKIDQLLVGAACILDALVQQLQ